jgi:hypothetical protein
MARRTAEEYRAQARRCRVLADAGVAEEYETALREMATKYDRFARALVNLQTFDAALRRGD